MPRLFYKPSQLNAFKQLTYKDFGASSKWHEHKSDTIGVIPIEQGGLFNIAEDNDFSSFVGPITYDTNNQLYHFDMDEGGVYFGRTRNDTNIEVGMPDWEQGGIPYTTEKEQLENMWRQIPANGSIFIPKLITQGQLLENGKEWESMINISYILPDNISSVDISGQYIIRQNGYCLFTSGKNYHDNGFAENFTNRPSPIDTPQTIIKNQTEQCSVIFDDNNLKSGVVTLHWTSQNDQTEEYNYLASNTTPTPAVCKGRACCVGTTTLYNTTLTFNCD